MGDRVNTLKLAMLHTPLDVHNTKAELSEKAVHRNEEND